MSAYSAKSVFDDFQIQLYNAVFTAFPPAVLAIVYWDLMTDIDGPEYEALLGKLYYIGQLRKAFNIKNFLLMMAQAVFDSAAIFFICF